MAPWRGLDDLELSTLEYIDWFNHRRLHGQISMIPPLSWKPSTTVKLTQSTRPKSKQPNLH